MFCVRQALRFGTRLACAQYSSMLYYRCTPIIHKLSGTSFRQNRLIHEDASDRKELGKLEGKMKLMFTCKQCKTRNSKIISKLAYEKGVIIVRCDGCKNNHLIADNLGWFADLPGRINIEKIMALKGETVRRIMNDKDGYYEIIAKEGFNAPSEDSNAEAKIGDSNNNMCSVKIDKSKTSRED
ncbi:PREDICTED: DNL-type zinc finger protein-like [Dinoponera quadriceps]|uniref:DNL-type zinc finger protein-like n=1 Tax=Dinoponera quadriceps TaxID=609295 RepID=A0A6P3Y775_DINQU|nr:PREDICTED: DNL-type zinc finger protein-like [Dinoponera quadriceps]